MISSVVSFSKVDIYEQMPGMMIADYHISPESVLHVEDSFYYKPDLEGNQDRIPVTSEQLALSLVNMHLTSQLEYRPGQHPAVFAVPNMEVKNIDDAKKRYQIETLTALNAQRKWFGALIKLADDDWQQLHRHNMISEIQRIAARSLGLKREWLVVLDEEKIESDCPFCGSDLLNPLAPICPKCGRVLNAAKVKELELRLGVAKTVEVKPS